MPSSSPAHNPQLGGSAPKLDLNNDANIGSADNDSPIDTSILFIKELQRQVVDACHELDLVKRRNEVLLRRCKVAETERSSFSLALDVAQADLRYHQQYYTKWQIAQQELEDMKRQHDDAIDRTREHTAMQREVLDNFMNRAQEDYLKIKSLKSEIRQMKGMKGIGEEDKKRKEEDANDSPLHRRATRKFKEVDAENQKLVTTKPTSAGRIISAEIRVSPLKSSAAQDSKTTSARHHLSRRDSFEYENEWAACNAMRAETMKKLRAVPLIDITDGKLAKGMGEKRSKLDKGKERKL